MTDSSFKGGAIGAGLFVGSGSALQTGGPGSLVCYYTFLVNRLVVFARLTQSLGAWLHHYRLYVAMHSSSSWRTGCPLPC